MKAYIVYFLLLITITTTASASNWHKMEAGNGQILLEIELFGSTATALIDSGADFPVISQKLYNRHKEHISLGKKFTVMGVYKEQKLPTAKNFTLALGKQEFRVKNAIIAPQLSNYDIILGADLFQNYVVQIDYPEKRIRFVPPRLMPLKKIANTKIKPGYTSAAPLIQLKVDNLTYWFILDTGSNGSLLVSREAARRIKSLEQEPVGQVEIRTAFEADTTLHNQYEIDNVSIGPFTLDGVLVEVPVKNKDMLVTDKTSTRSGRLSKQLSHGILGYDILKHFVVTLDQRQSLLHLGTSS